MANPRIGVLIIPTDPYWVLALDAIIHTGQKTGAELVMLHMAANHSDLFALPHADLADQVLAYHLDALISSLIPDPVLHAILDAGLPVIYVAETQFRHPLFIPMQSLYEGGKIAGDFIGRRLSGSGRAICVTAGNENLPITGKSRLAGFRDGLAPSPRVIIEHVPAYWGYAQAYPALLEFFSTYTLPVDALFGVSDTLILAARDAARACGKINRHTLLVGLNGDPMALSAVAEGDLDATVNTSSEKVGATAVQIAHAAATGMQHLSEIPLSYQLVTRENVADLAIHKLAALADIPSHLVGYFRELEHDRLSQLEVSTHLTQQIGLLQERSHIIQVISEVVEKYFGFEWTRILRWNEKENRLEPYAGSAAPDLAPLPVQDDRLLQQSFTSNEVIYIPDVRTSRRWQVPDAWKNVRSRALLPIQLGSETIGILDLQSSRVNCQPTPEILGLRLLASQLGIVIQNADLYLEALRAKECAERANQLKTRLVVNVGHEMRSPLNAILGFSQSLQKQLTQNNLPGSQSLVQDVRNIYRSGEHLMYMINDILDLSRAEIGALSLYFESLYPTPYLREVFESFSRSEAQNEGVAWVLDVPSEMPVIRADVVRLRQILVNLLANAAKYTRKGAITLGAEVEPPFLRIWVKDTGQGVPVELQKKIFEPFGVSERKRRPEGIGLGLSITRHLVALHNGLITLESKMGEGSTFNVYLPLPGLASEPIAHPRTANTPLMLVVTSTACIPEAIRRICENRGYEPVQVSTLAQLRAALSTGEPVAIAWDKRSASPTEWALLQHMSAHQDCAALPMILFNQDSTGSSEDGLTQVVFKPATGNTIRGWIEQLAPEDHNSGPLLVVDDDEDARRFYHKLLEECRPGRQVLLAENGKHALKIMQDQTPALVLLDLIMPEVDGFTVLDEIRANPRLQRIPVVIISGKLLNYDDVQRLNHLKTYLLTKNMLSQEETSAFLEQVEAGGKQIPQQTSIMVKRCLAYIHQNYADHLNRRDIAEALGLSENYLSQIFRQEMSITPWDYLQRYRVQKATDLLLNTTASITEISGQVGFNDPAYFSRVFHKVTGQ
ncbi:MAG TPA: ATP-binding protein, partial [Anaerolinea sp.]|nr:ATP-binding protein [Anaerolinea sp.]